MKKTKCLHKNIEEISRKVYYFKYGWDRSNEDECLETSEIICQKCLDCDGDIDE